MYDILFEYFDSTFEWAHQFHVCDVEVNPILGGNTNKSILGDIIPCNGNIPCFVKTNTQQRRLRLTDTDETTDGSVSVILSSQNADRQKTLETLKLEPLAIEIKSTFENKFHVNLG
eukprot:861414_1